MSYYFRKIPAFISYALMIAGVLVMIGWYFDIVFFKSVSELWVPMRFVSAICFIMSGLTLISIEKENRTLGVIGIDQIFLSMSSLSIILLMTFYVISKFFYVNIDIESIFIRSGETAALSKLSLFSAYNFFLVGIIGIMTLFKAKRLKAAIFTAGTISAITGLSGMLGYIFNLPSLYFSIDYLSAPMAANTAFLFLLLGTAFLIIGIRKEE